MSSHLLCTNQDACGILIKTESYYDSVLVKCPQCLSPAVVFPDKISAVKAANKNESEKEVRVKLIAKLISKLKPEV